MTYTRTVCTSCGCTTNRKSIRPSLRILSDYDWICTNTTGIISTNIKTIYATNKIISYDNSISSVVSKLITNSSIFKIIVIITRIASNFFTNYNTSTSSKIFTNSNSTVKCNSTAASTCICNFKTNRYWFLLIAVRNIFTKTNTKLTWISNSMTHWNWCSSMKRTFCNSNIRYITSIYVITDSCWIISS